MCVCVCVVRVAGSSHRLKESKGKQKSTAGLLNMRALTER